MDDKQCSSSRPFMENDQVAPDEVDGIFSSCLKKPKEDRNGSDLAVIKDGILSNYYNMEYPHNGFLFIFAHEYFTVARARNRTSCKEDVKMLKKTFTKLNFKITILNDFRLRDIRKFIAKVSRENFNEFASLAIAVSTHGYEDGIAAYDEVYVPEIELMDPFKDNTTLFGKPKMFFLECCRGEQIDDGVTVLSSTETDGSYLREFMIPKEADILIAYSTVQGFVAYNNEPYGSQFFIYLTKTLEKYSKDEDLMTILTYANRALSVNFSSVNDDNKAYNNKKQCMCILQTLTRKIKFKLKREELLTKRMNNIKLND